jgi:O-antigen/teichoic acid export membrane protein
VLLATAPAALALLLARHAAMVDLFGGGYLNAVPLLASLAPAVPALAFNLYGGYLFGAAGRMGWMAGLYAAATALKVALDAWLIPSWGVQGAALVTLLSEVVLAAAFALALGRVLNAGPRARTAGVLAVVGGLAAIAALLPDPTGGLLRAAALVLATGVLYRLAGVVTPEEWGAVSGALSRRRTAPRETPRGRERAA